MNNSFIINHSKVVEVIDDANQLIGYHFAFEDAFANVVINEDGNLSIDDWDSGCIEEEDFDNVVFESILSKLNTFQLSSNQNQ